MRHQMQVNRTVYRVLSIRLHYRCGCYTRRRRRCVHVVPTPYNSINTILCNFVSVIRTSCSIWRCCFIMSSSRLGSVLDSASIGTCFTVYTFQILSDKNFYTVFFSSLILQTKTKGWLYVFCTAAVCCWLLFVKNRSLRPILPIVIYGNY